MRITLFFMLLVLASSLSAQHDYQWWVNKHNWDGHTHWKNMLTISPAFLGPNALPVPELRTAEMEQEWNLQVRPEWHYAKGDNTVDVFTSLIVPLGKRASFEVFVVPLEYYNISDTNIRDERLIRSLEPKGLIGGDIWFGTNIQVVKDNDKWPDIQFSAYFKTASGLMIEDMRYTDAPSYTMFLSAGKYISGNSESASSLRWYANLGAYIWQTYDNLHNQDDALNYGFGLRWKASSYFVKTEVAGYLGYIGVGDRPLLLRGQIGKSYAKTELALRYQIGLNDYPYQTFGLSLTRRFSRK